MHYVLGTLALLGVGFIGLLIEIHKQDRQEISLLNLHVINMETENDGLIAENEVLRANQKPVPWNKGKKYTLPRGVNGKPLRKKTTYILSDGAIDHKAIVADWGEPIG
jgi:hypothetical protein